MSVISSLPLVDTVLFVANAALFFVGHTYLTVASACSRIAADAANAPIVPDTWDMREAVFQHQFLRIIERQCTEQRSRSPEELHGSWMQAYFDMGWVYGDTYDRENKVHPDLVPYADLGQLERDKDEVFVALCEIARQWIYDDGSEAV